MMNKNEQLVQRVARAVREAGGCAYYVGGCVRDSLLGVNTKDLDVEVHGITPEQLKAILSDCGTVKSFGASFGVYAVCGYDVDFAMPRKETKIGEKHRDFAVSVNPYLGIKGACRRRDFTVNAMMRDVITDKLYDPFGGAADLKNGILRHVCTETFTEDPLRVLRGAQFAARFGLTPADETLALFRSMDLSSLSRERVKGELKKALLYADNPSIFFRVLRQADGLRPWFSEIYDLIGVCQNPLYHPEGDVFCHTMATVDAAAKLRNRAQYPYYFMIAALVHDFGKITATAQKDGVWHAYMHEVAAEPIVRAFLHRLTRERELTAYAQNMALLHMRPGMLNRGQSSPKATNRMFDQSVCPEDLLLLYMSDRAGQGIAMQDWGEFLTARLALYRQTMARPQVTGKDLIAAGVMPNAHFREYLAYARKLHLAGIDKKSALKQTLSFIRQYDKQEEKLTLKTIPQQEP